jgi:hypothetical protein
MIVTETTVQPSNITEFHQGHSCITVKVAHHSTIASIASLTVTESTSTGQRTAREKIKVAHSETAE